MINEKCMIPSGRKTQILSNAMAIPIPPPIHIVAIERFEFVNVSKLAALPVILAPEAPNG